MLAKLCSPTNNSANLELFSFKFTFKLTSMYSPFRPFTIPQVLRTIKKAQVEEDEGEEEDTV